MENVVLFLERKYKNKPSLCTSTISYNLLLNILQCTHGKLSHGITTLHHKAIKNSQNKCHYNSTMIVSIQK